MDIFSTTVQIAQIVQKIYEGCQAYRGADSTIEAMQLRLDNVGIRLELFQKYFSKNSTLLTEKEEAILRRSLENLEDLLEILSRKLPSSPSIPAKLAWVGWEKQSAERILSQLKDWDADVQGTIFTLDILSKVRNDDVLFKRFFDTGERALTPAWALSKRIHESSNALLSLPIPLSLLSLRSPHNDGTLATIGDRTVYVETYHIERNGAEEKQKWGIRRLASVFHSELLPKMHLLSCEGVAEDYKDNCAYLIYELPAGLNLERSSHLPTLAYALEKRVRMSLEDRYRLAVEITTAVMEIHAAGWVHKSIRSDTVLVKTVEDKADLNGVAAVGSAFLVGFTAARPQRASSSNGRSLSANDIQRLYLHPERQGIRQDSLIHKFDLRHDMYSLGAVLLEIGYQMTLQDIVRPPLSKNTHQRLIDNAHRLSEKMGSKYTQAALVCLTKSTEKGKQLDDLREEFYEEVLSPMLDILAGFKRREVHWKA